VKRFVAVAMISLACTISFLIITVWAKPLRKPSAKKYWEYVDTLVVSSH